MSEYFIKPIVKTLMLKGQEGQSIKGIKKTSTNGLVDTYTITLTDGTTSTFTVTNGKEISSISKTGTSGLVDTYTITLTDGTASTFTVTNGKEISSISKTGTSGLVDTYTIRFNDGTTSTFTVTNGESVPSGGTTGQFLKKKSNSDYDYVWETLYPVGSIYISVNSTSPAELFGGTWEQIKDRFLLGASETYSSGSTGGEETHTLTVEEIPSHVHGQKVTNEVANGGVSGRADYDKDSSHLGDYPQGCWTLPTGGGKPHNNMPPYLAVYMWKRIS